MTVDDDLRTLRLALAPAGSPDPQEHDRLLLTLRAELSGLDVEALGAGLSLRPPEPVRTVAPQIVIGLSGTGGALATVLDALRAWLGRQPERHQVTVDLDGDRVDLVADTTVTAEQADRVAAFVQRQRRD